MNNFIDIQHGNGGRLTIRKADIISVVTNKIEGEYGMHELFIYTQKERFMACYMKYKQAVYEHHRILRELGEE